MCVGEIVYLPIREGFVKYIIKKIVNDELLVLSYKTGQANWVEKSDVLSLIQLQEIYNNEEIYG